MVAMNGVLRKPINYLGFDLLRRAPRAHGDTAQSWTFEYEDLPEIGTSTISIRAQTSDIEVFRQIFIEHEYSGAVGILRQFQTAGLISSPLRILDAGANVGLTSLYLARRLGDVRIVSVEPCPGNFAQLKRTISLNGFDDRIQPLLAGVWNRRTRVSNRRGFRDGRSWANQIEPVREGDEGIMAYSIPWIADEYLGGAIDFLKIDIEGSERELFSEEADARAFLEKTKVIALEIHDEVADRILIERTLRDSGFLLFHSGELTWGVRFAELQRNYD
jgi:FkbM family methyltransferase